MNRTRKISLRELVLFSLFGAMMFVSAQIDIIPNVHQLALFISVTTMVYRVKALIPIYLYVFLEGLFGGFGLWWIPYLYIWTVLWALIMLIPKSLNTYVTAILITVACALHGICFGIMYAPFQCLLYFKGNFDMMIPWVISGLPYDVVHMLGNIAASAVAVPLIKLLCSLEGKPVPFGKREK